MPAAFPRACRSAGCANTTTARNGYCDTHKHTNWETYQDGKSADERGYGSEWKRLRKRVIERANGICEECIAWSRVVPGTDVDHIVSKAKGGTDSLDNLQLLCKHCHGKKTARERYE